MLNRKMSMLRKIIRKTNKTKKQTYTLRKPKQSKYISTCYKNRTIQTFTSNTPQTRVRNTQIRHLFLHLPYTSLSIDKLFRIKRLQLSANMSVLEFCTYRQPGYMGTRVQPNPRAHEYKHTSTTPTTNTRARATKTPSSKFNLNIQIK